MYYASKVKRATFNPETIGRDHNGQVYIAYCDSRRPSNEEFARESFFFIARGSYEEVAKEIQELHPEPETNKALTLLTDYKFLSETEHHKYVIPIRDAYYHYLVNTLTTILFIAENDPKAEFYLFTGNHGGSEWRDVYIETRKNVDFLSYLLNFHGIRHYLLVSDIKFDNHSYLNKESIFYQENSGNPEIEKSMFCFAYPVYKFSNVTIVRDYAMCFDRTLGDIAYFMDKYVKTLDRVKPSDGYKKIYISRDGQKSPGSAFIDPDKPELGYKDDRRIYNENKLEDYLKDKGFYILKPKNFNNHFEQFSILSSASLIVGPTGTGMINSLFMDSGKTVVELRLEQQDVQSGAEQQIVPYYGDYAYAKGHKYIALDVSDKQADTAIEKLEDLFSLLDLDDL